MSSPTKITTAAAAAAAAADTTTNNNVNSTSNIDDTDATKNDTNNKRTGPRIFKGKRGIHPPKHQPQDDAPSSSRDSTNPKSVTSDSNMLVDDHDSSSSHKQQREEEEEVVSAQDAECMLNLSLSASNDSACDMIDKMELEDDTNNDTNDSNAGRERNQVAAAVAVAVKQKQEDKEHEEQPVCTSKAIATAPAMAMAIASTTTAASSSVPSADNQDTFKGEKVHLTATQEAFANGSSSKGESTTTKNADHETTDGKMTSGSAGGTATSTTALAAGEIMKGNGNQQQQQPHLPAMVKSFSGSMDGASAATTTAATAKGSTQPPNGVVSQQPQPHGNPYPVPQGYHHPPHYNPYHRHPAYPHHNPHYNPGQQYPGHHHPQHAAAAAAHHHHAHWTAAAHHHAQQYAGYYAARPPPPPQGYPSSSTGAAAATGTGTATGTTTGGGSAKPAVPSSLSSTTTTTATQPPKPASVPSNSHVVKKEDVESNDPDGKKEEEAKNGGNKQEDVKKSDPQEGANKNVVDKDSEASSAAKNDSSNTTSKDDNDTDKKDEGATTDKASFKPQPVPSSISTAGATAAATNAQQQQRSHAPPVPSSGSWNSHTSHPPPQVHGSHPHANYHPHHYGWHAHRAGYHPYHHPQQQHGGTAAANQQQQQQPHHGQHPPTQYSGHHAYWPGYHPQHHHAASHSQHRQHTAQHPGIAWTNSNASGSTTNLANTSSAASGANKKVNNKTTVSSAHSTTTAMSTASITTEGSKKRHREEEEDEPGTNPIVVDSGIVTSNGAIIESRDDFGTKGNSFMDDSMEDDDTSAGMSLGGFSMGSLGRISTNNDLLTKRRKGQSAGRNQSIHRTLSHGLNMPDDVGNLKLLEVSSTLSEGKMILKNLSINSSYSAEFADLCGPSPMNASQGNNSSANKSKTGEDSMLIDEGKTPKKRNTSNKKTKDQMAPLVFRLDGLTPAASCTQVGSDINDDSPTMFDLIGGAETPTTGMLMNNMMESALTDDIRSLNGHLRGQTFTPLPMMMSENLADGTGMSGGLSSVGGLSITPQLSWSTANGSPLEITPRCFGLLDSTKSSKSLKSGALGSPQSFWRDNVLDTKKDIGGNSATVGSADGKQGGVKSILSILSPTMREMNVANDGNNYGERSTSPLPLYYENKHGNADGSQEDGIIIKSSSSSSNDHTEPKTAQPMPIQSSPWGDYRGGRPNSGFPHSPIPHNHHHPPHHHHHGHPSPYRDGPPPPPPGYHHPHHHPSSMYPPHNPHNHGHYNPNERVRNLRGNGPPRHHLPPQHHLPPPSYHHFSPLTNVHHARGRYAGHHIMPHHLDLVSGTSKRKCVPIKPPIPSKFQGDIEKYKDTQIPDFNNLVNFPGHMNNKPSPNVPEGMRCCVMCGQACPCSMGGKNKKIKIGSSCIGGAGSASGDTVAPLGDSTGSNTNNGNVPTSSAASMATMLSTASNSYANIPTQNKGLCTMCDVNVWIVTSSGLEIKWCKGCKNFRPWAAFGDKGLATKCVRCRERQREKYALQKEEKEKMKGMTKTRMQQNPLQQRQQQVRQVATSAGTVSIGQV